MKKLLFLYNTHAGKGLLKSRLAAVQDALAAAGWDVTIHPTPVSYTHLTLPTT